jgi:hypothetical protein
MLVSDSTHIPPTGTNWPGPDLLGDLVEQLGVVLLDPGVLLRRGASELERRVGVRELDHIGKSACALADRLPYGPQPSTIDVRVPNGDDPVRAGRCRPGERLRQLSPGGRRSPGDIVRVGDVDRALQREQDLGAPAGVEWQLVHQSRQRRDVGAQLPNVDVPQSQGKLLDHVQRCVNCGSEIPVGSRQKAGVPDVGVGRGLEVELDRCPRRNWEVVVER